MADRAGKKRRYITGFDGLRAIAVLGVIVFHLWPTSLAGGWLGVPLFFVLSGYLITDILIQEFDQTNRINIGGFYVRRMKRLYPALVVMLLATATFIQLFARPLLYNLRAILTTNLTYVYNIWATKHGDSYFDQWGGSSPFTHLWSLSIEGQFYIFWPIIVLILLKLHLKRQKISIGILVVAALSALMMAILYNPANINRVYYGTDTRMFAILVGTALAFSWPSRNLNSLSNQFARKILNWTGVVAGGLFLLGFFFLNGQWTSTYHGLMFLMTLLAGIVIAVTAHPSSWFSKGLNRPFLNYLGTRSYSIYLYQLPVFVFYDKLIHNSDSFSGNLMKIIIVFALAELSYQFIEKVFKRYYGVLNVFAYDSVRIYATIVMVLTVMAVSGVMTKQAGEARPKTQLENRLDKNKQALAAANKRAKAAIKKAQTSSSASKKPTDKPAPVTEAQALKYHITDKEYDAMKGNVVTAVGDSVMLDAGPDLQDLMPNTLVDAQVGRQSQQAVDIIHNMAVNHTLAPNLVIAIGTNGSLKPEMIDSVMQSAGTDREVYWVNAYADRSWVPDNNHNLDAANKRYKNLHVIDWSAAVMAGHKDWLSPDEVHPNIPGSVEYVSLIAQEIARVQSK
ncbi:MAG: acetyltransferase [Lactobacillaceae bacterium]|jgi:peptidoglycan/LPS O-acetylase OafA/YrhL|nr:acetyltransferase [Lactobacillaceae bacterium]